MSDAVDEAAWLRGCWAPQVADLARLARFRAGVTAGLRTSEVAFREIGRIPVALHAVRELDVETRLARHNNTVMDLAVAPTGIAASVDFSGRWSVWSEDDMRERHGGDFRHEVRAITLSDDGARMAALVNLGESALYQYDAFVLELGRPKMILCSGHHVTRLQWQDDFLVLGGARGYRVHDAAGVLVCADESPKGLSAACFVPATSGGELHCVRRDVLGCVEIGAARALADFSLQSLGVRGQIHLRPSSFDVRRAGDLAVLGPHSNDVFVLDLARQRPIVHLAIDGVHIVGMKVAFDTSGRYVLISATHFRGEQVTHLVYDGLAGAVVGAITTAISRFAHHGRIAMSSDGCRVFAADGRTIVVAQMPGCSR